MASEGSLMYLAHGSESGFATAVIVSVNKGAVKVQ